jgi:hypothetical protein
VKAALLTFIRLRLRRCQDQSEIVFRSPWRNTKWGQICSEKTPVSCTISSTASVAPMQLE